GDHRPAEAHRLTLRWAAGLAGGVAHAHPGDVVLLDGPLRSDASVQNVLGFVKSTSRERLPPSQRGVLAGLAPGQRSPVYRVHGGDRSLLSRLEWVMRPRGAAPGVDPRLGLVRVQANSALSRAEAAALADWTAATLPAYATDYHHDPRAPQQLLIVKDLESDLRRSFGHRDLLLTALRQERSGGGAFRAVPARARQARLPPRPPQSPPPSPSARGRAALHPWSMLSPGRR